MQVRLSAGESLCTITRLLRPEDRGRHALTLVLQLAHDDEQEELRMTAVSKCVLRAYLGGGWVAGWFWWGWVGALSNQHQCLPFLLFPLPPHPPTTHPSAEHNPPTRPPCM
jgi:hypothetical protein